MMRKKATKIITSNHVENCIKWPEGSCYVHFALTLFLYWRGDKEMSCVWSFFNWSFDFGVCWPHALTMFLFSWNILLCFHLLLLISLKWVSNFYNFAITIWNFMVFFWIYFAFVSHGSYLWSLVFWASMTGM